MPIITEVGNAASNSFSFPDFEGWDEFIPYVALDSSGSLEDEENDKGEKKFTIVPDDDDKVQLSEHIEEGFQNHGVLVLTTKENKFKLPFSVAKASDESHDPDGWINVQLSIDDPTVQLTTQIPIETQYEKTFELELEITSEERKEFYIDFYADDNDDYFDGELENVFCGRMKIVFEVPEKFKKACYSISIMKETDYRSNRVRIFRDFIKVKNAAFGSAELSAYLEEQNSSVSQNESEYDGEEIHFMAIFSHGIESVIWGDGEDIESTQISSMFNNKLINFSENALIYLGACNAGTGASNSFAQELSNVTRARVIGMVNDGVAPVKESGVQDSDQVMKFGPKMGSKYNGKFYEFNKTKLPKEIGKYVDVLKLIDDQKKDN